MSNKIFFLFLVIFSLNSFSQNYDYIDSKAKNYSNILNTSTLSDKIENDFNTDEEKVRALFIWLVENIKYYTDKKSWVGTSLEYYFSEYQEKRDSKRKEKTRILNALKNRRANCYGYSLIFKEVCDLLNIESHIILGYAKGNLLDIGKNSLIKNHAWNSVKINNQWQLIDISWAIGYYVIEKKANNGHYYFKNPTEFINQHLPVHAKWQLTPHKISKKDFISTPILYPKYYNSKFKLLNENNGIIKISKKDRYFTIIFSKIPKDYNISYSFLNEKYSKPLFFKKINNHTYKLKIRFNKREAPYITIYSDFIPLIAYKIELAD